MKRQRKFLTVTLALTFMCAQLSSALALPVKKYSASNKTVVGFVVPMPSEASYL